LVKLVNDTGIPSLEAELEEIRDLDPPSEDEAEVEAVLDAFEKRVQKATAKPLLLVRGLEFDEYHDKTGAYGFKVCGQR